MNSISPALGLGGLPGSPAIPNGPHQIAVNEKTGDVFVSSDRDGTVSVMNARQQVSVARLAVSPGSQMHVRVSPGDNSAVVLVDTPAGFGEQDALYKITPDAFGQPQVEGPIQVENGDYPRGFDVDTGSGAVFLGNNRSGNLLRVAPGPDGRLSGASVQSAPMEPGVKQVAFDPASGGVFVLNHDQHSLRHVSAQETSNPLDVGPGSHFQMAVNRGKGTVAVLNETDNTLHRFSADGTEQKWTLPAGQHKLAAHDGIGAFIVANREAGNVMGFIDGPASEPMTFNTGKQPVDLAVDTALSDAFVLNTDGSLSVITPDGKTMEATSINCQVGPFSFPSIEPGGRQAMAVNSTTHEVFLANEGSATLSRITQNGASVHSLSGQA